jgi:phage/plasmid-like protein (TIGR03299 family)
MSHEIESDDGVVLHKRAAWHGLGVVVDEAPTAREALQIAGLGWRVDPVEVSTVETTDTSDGSTPRTYYRPVPGFAALRRSDTGRVFSVQSAGYRPLQNGEVADLIDALAAEGSIPKCETAGSLRHGRDVFFLVKVGSFAALPGDEVREYVLFHNRHDGTASFSVRPAAVRVVCANTLAEAGVATGREAFGAGKGVLRFVHAAGILERVKGAREALQAALRETACRRDDILALAQRRITSAEESRYLRGVHDAVYGRFEDLSDAAKDRANARIRRWYALGREGKLQHPDAVGTAWGAYNGISDWSDHENAGGAKVDAGYRKLFGSGADLKSAAFAGAVELLK